MNSISIPHPFDFEACCKVSSYNSLPFASGITFYEDEPQRLIVPPPISLNEDLKLIYEKDPNICNSIFITRSNGCLQCIYPIPSSIGIVPISVNCETILVGDDFPCDVADVQFFAFSTDSKGQFKILGCSLISKYNQLSIYGLLHKSPSNYVFQSVKL